METENRKSPFGYILATIVILGFLFVTVGLPAIVAESVHINSF